MDLIASDIRARARSLYWQGWRVCRIAETLGLKKQTIHSWKRREGWDAVSPLDRVENAIEARLVQLAAKEDKEPKDFKEIDLLGRQMERAARVRKYLSGGNEGDLNPNMAGRAKGRRPSRNAVSDAQAEKLRAVFKEGLFDYQRAWRDAGEKHRIRNILKSRQIGATWFFAREALIDALTTKRNQIFISASRAQARVFREYIVAFAREAADVELTGSPMTLSNGATLYFLSNNSATAQSYHGNLYFDEYFWTRNFAELRKVASGMALHNGFRQTYFSTPSSQAHEAYPFWTGDLYNDRHGKGKALFDFSPAALRAGKAFADRQWRQVVTVEDAVAGGCTLFDLDHLRHEYSAEEYANLLMCHFIDDADSVFTMALLMRAMVDSGEAWPDVSPFAARPFGDRPVWIGYDPASTGDSAALAVVAPPASSGGKFRLLERRQFRGLDFEAQARAIREACGRYRVEFIGIDSTGMGLGVLELTRQFFPAAESIRYAIETKTALVLKGLDIFSKGRFEFDSAWTDVAHAFLAIRKTTTDSGRRLTFKADRGQKTNHADLAWATLHALSHEPLARRDGDAGGFMEII